MSDCSITLPTNRTLVSCKTDYRAQYNVTPLTILKKFDPKSDLSQVKTKLSAYNNSKIPECIDRRPLNEAIKCKHVHLPTV